MTAEEARKAADIMCKAYDDGYDAGYAKAQARIKELEEAASALLSAKGPEQFNEAQDRLRSILNKK